jgi:hypothetical protein
MPDTSAAAPLTTDPLTQPTAPIGGRLVVTEQPGLPIVVQLDTDDGSAVREIALGPIDAIVFAHRLTAAALRRFGRVPVGGVLPSLHRPETALCEGDCDE